jgi:hypothetical protein
LLSPKIIWIHFLFVLWNLILMASYLLREWNLIWLWCFEVEHWEVIKIRKKWESEDIPTCHVSVPYLLLCDTLCHAGTPSPDAGLWLTWTSRTVNQNKLFIIGHKLDCTQQGSSLIGKQCWQLFRKGIYSFLTISFILVLGNTDLIEWVKKYSLCFYSLK